MITKFSALYVGQIELDNVGRDGTPADERRHAPRHHARAAPHPPPRGDLAAIASGKTLPYIAQRGIKGMVTLNEERIFDQVARAYQAEAAKAGRRLALGEDLCWGVGLSLAETQEEAVRRIEPSHDERYKWFAPFGFVRYADQEGRPWGTPGAPARQPTIQDGVKQRAWLCGPPSYVIEQIRDFEARYPGLDQMMIHWAEGMPPKEFKEQLSWFARDVMPAFAGRR